MKAILILVLALLAGCTNSQQASRALEGAGYTSIHMDGFAWFGCGQDDMYTDAFHARGPTGQLVSGVVCSGWLKGSTIRLD